MCSQQAQESKLKPLVFSKGWCFTPRISGIIDSLALKEGDLFPDHTSLFLVAFISVHLHLWSAS